MDTEALELNPFGVKLQAIVSNKMKSNDNKSSEYVQSIGHYSTSGRPSFIGIMES